MTGKNNARKAGRPPGPKVELKSFSFEMPAEQHQAGSDKSAQGKVFNLSLYFRLVHKHRFLGRPLEESQRELNELMALDQKEAARTGRR
jgi:hypothetical protein